MFVLYIIAGIFVLFASLQVYTFYLAKRSKGMHLSGLQGDLKKLEQPGSRGLVYFHSPSCHACKVQTPVVKKLQTKYRNLYAVDVSKDYTSAKVFGVKATPTMVQVENGIVKDIIIGARQEQAITAILSGM
jgi:thiol-disulfide isomerase/thioredoxin